MKLERLFAYEVIPQKNSKTPTIPDGGKISVGNSLRLMLEQIIHHNRLEQQTPISFQVDDPAQPNRRNEVREAILNFAFETVQKASTNAGQLALRLSQCMDDRSHPFLLLLTSFRAETQARVIIFAFPRDEGLKFSMTPKGANVKVVKDIFNVSSNLKKAAMFTGENSHDSFWEGRMVDIQSGRTDLWVERFLACQLSLSGIHGTSQLCEYLTTAYCRTAVPQVRDELFNAIIAARTMPQKRISFYRFANNYLGNDAKSELLGIIPVDFQNLSFDFDRTTFEKKIGIRVFRMADEVIVAAPLLTINKSLQIKLDQLEYTGTIKKEYLKGAKSV